MDGLDDYTSKLESFEDVIAWKKKYLSVSLLYKNQTQTFVLLDLFHSS